MGGCKINKFISRNAIVLMKNVKTIQTICLHLIVMPFLKLVEEEDQEEEKEEEKEKEEEEKHEPQQKSLTVD